MKGTLALLHVMINCVCLLLFIWWFKIRRPLTIEKITRKLNARGSQIAFDVLAKWNKSHPFHFVALSLTLEKFILFHLDDSQTVHFLKVEEQHVPNNSYYDINQQQFVQTSPISCKFSDSGAVVVAITDAIVSIADDKFHFNQDKNNQRIVAVDKRCSSTNSKNQTVLKETISPLKRQSQEKTNEFFLPKTVRNAYLDCTDKETPNKILCDLGKTVNLAYELNGSSRIDCAASNDCWNKDEGFVWQTSALVKLRKGDRSYYFLCDENNLQKIEKCTKDQIFVKNVGCSPVNRCADEVDGKRFRRNNWSFWQCQQKKATQKNCFDGILSSDGLRCISHECQAQQESTRIGKFDFFPRSTSSATGGILCDNGEIITKSMCKIVKRNVKLMLQHKPTMVFGEFAIVPKNDEEKNQMVSVFFTGLLETGGFNEAHMSCFRPIHFRGYSNFDLFQKIDGINLRIVHQKIEIKFNNLEVDLLFYDIMYDQTKKNFSTVNESEALATIVYGTNVFPKFISLFSNCHKFLYKSQSKQANDDKLSDLSVLSKTLKKHGAKLKEAILLSLPKNNWQSQKEIQDRYIYQRTDAIDERYYVCKINKPHLFLNEFNLFILNMVGREFYAQISPVLKKQFANRNILDLVVPQMISFDGGVHVAVLGGRIFEILDTRKANNSLVAKKFYSATYENSTPCASFLQNNPLFGKFKGLVSFNSKANVWCESSGRETPPPKLMKLLDSSNTGNALFDLKRSSSFLYQNISQNADYANKMNSGIFYGFASSFQLYDHVKLQQ